MEKRIALEMTKQEFYSWCDEHREKVLALYAAGETPSIDRKDSSLPYNLNNIRIISWYNNTLLGARASAVKHSKPVVGTHIETGEKIHFASRQDAKRAGFDSPAIWRCLAGKWKYHRKYTWSEAQ